MSLDIFLLFLISKVNFFITDFLICENNLKVLFFKSNIGKCLCFPAVNIIMVFLPAVYSVLHWTAFGAESLRRKRI